MTMAETTTWIKIDRKLLKWRWFKNGNVLKVWLFLLIRANMQPNEFENIAVQRGQLVTSYKTISEYTGLTYDQSRRAIQHLKVSGEITYLRTRNFLVISIENYDEFQGTYQTFSQSNANQMPIKPQSYPNNLKKENIIKNGKNNARVREDDRAWETELDVPEQFRGRFGSKKDWLKWWEGGDPDEV